MHALHASKTPASRAKGEEEDEDRLVRLISGQVHAPHLVLSGLYDDPLPSDESASPRHRPLGCKGFRICWLVGLARRHVCRQWPKLLQSPRNVVGRWGLGCGRGALVEGEEIDL